ncbi:hypothetical protein GCM10020218_066390 [Dactylosporangium vinaceum]
MLGQQRGEHCDKRPGEQPMVVDDDYCDGHRRTTLVACAGMVRTIGAWAGPPSPAGARDRSSAARTRRITLIDPYRA